MSRPIATAAAALVTALTLVAQDAWVAAQEDPHAYFNALVARGDHWKSFSLRDPGQLDHPKNGGYANSNSVPLSVTYSPSTDPDPNRQDAAKLVIPAFSPSTTLSAAIGPSDLFIPLTALNKSLWSQGRAVKVGSEIMVVNRPSGTVIEGNLLPVFRGQHGTTPTSHISGSTVHFSQNSLPNQVRLPLGTSDGNTYLFTWDGYWTSSYVRSGLSNHKAFQFSSGGDSLWLEPQTRFDGGGSEGKPAGFDPDIHVAGIEARSYANPGGTANWAETDGNSLGPGVTNNQPIAPRTGSFILKANTWTRFWVRVHQRANDYDSMDMWVADENTGPVHIYANIPLSVKPFGSIPNSIVKFWLELNTSTTGFARGDERDLVAYMRNYVALVNPPSNVSSLLLRPSSHGLVPIAGPFAPKNLKIISGPPN